MTNNQELFLNCLFLVFGPLIACGEVLGFVDPFLVYYGLGMFFFAFMALTSFVYLLKFDSVIGGAIVSACFTTVVFCIFAGFGAIPGIPQKDMWSYMLIATPFICVGGSVTSVDFFRINGKDVTVITRRGLFGQIVDVIFKR